MQHFDFYLLAWAIYIVLGCLLLFLLDLKLRRFGFKVRAGVLTLIAVGAFTPQMVKDADTFAPLILNCVLNAEVDGVSAIYQGLLTLVAIWGTVFAVTLAVKHFINASQSGKKKGK